MSNTQVQPNPDNQNKILQIDEMFQMMQKKFQNTFNQPTNNLTLSIKKTNLQVVIQNKNQQNFQNKPPTDRKRRSVKKYPNQAIKSGRKNNNENTSDSITHRSNIQQSQSPLNNNQPQSNTSSPYKKISIDLKHQNTNSDSKQTQSPRNDQSHSPKHNQSNSDQKSNLVQSNIKSTSILDYKDLQQKIQSALKRNSKFSKQFSSPSSLIKSNLTSQSFSQFNQSLLNRFDQYERKKQRQIQRKKQQLEQRQQKQLKFHPKINKKSQKVVQEMGGHEPIQNRYQKILQAKNKKIQQHQQKKKLKQEQEYQKFMQQFQKYKKTPQDSSRSYEQFYEEMLKWKERAKKNVQEKKRLIQQKQIKQSNQFKPKINKKSQKILLNSAKLEKRVPIYERQVPSQKRFKHNFDEECTFKPKINKRKVK